MKISQVLTTTVVVLSTIALCSGTSVAASSADEFDPCTEQDVKNMYYMMQNEIDECATDSNYEFLSDVLPSSTQRKALCKCKPLMKKVTQVYFPRCKFTLSRNQYPFREAMESVLVSCQLGRLKEEVPPPTLAPGSGDAEETPSPTPTPEPTPEPTTELPVIVSSSGSASANSSIGSDELDDSGSDSEVTVSPVDETVAPATSSSAPSTDEAGRAPVTKPDSHASSVGVASVSVALAVVVSSLWN